MYLSIASTTFQGLSTCHALQAKNTIRAQDLLAGEQINVPLRCACPTRTQIDNGENYLLSYIIAPNEFLSTIGEQFAVNISQIRAANELSETETNIYPFTTLLIPLRDPPTSTQATAPQPPPPPAAATIPVSPPSGGGSNRTWIYVLVGILGGGLILGTLILCLLFYKKKKKFEPAVSTQSFESIEKPSNKESNGEDESMDFLESISSIAQSLKVYTFGEIKFATDDFSPNRLIKGSVYRGTINGDFAAIKRMNGDVSKEINLLNKINHFNLVRLSGVAFNEGNWYLVYEYASNGSLHDWIVEKKIIKMNWDQRLQIAVDVAAGLNYLHNYTSPPYVHKDLNSSNVLLDAECRAKIANFGLARSAEGQEGQFALTRHIVGTKGYMAPEYLENGVVSPKLDVYAFGVLLFEILSGKEVSTFGANMQLSDILSEDESLTNLMDPTLEGKYPQELLHVVFGLIDSCVKKDASDRPSMDNVFKTLTRILSGKEVSTFGANMQLSDILSEDESSMNLMDPTLEGKYPQELVRVLFGLIDNCVKKDASDRPSIDNVLKTLSRISTSSVSGEWAINISENQKTIPS
ncbi:LysM domain [Castilleja foliolosa]|uniref:LysM domain n=1 Tax=Castilleja foliolosa TaxID=1961234 RepID=A0ABD3E5I3_9LAMI